MMSFLWGSYLTLAVVAVGAHWNLVTEDGLLVTILMLGTGIAGLLIGRLRP